MSRGPTARDVPLLRAELAEFLGTGRAVDWLSGLVPTSPDQAERLAQRHQAAVEAAELFFVNDEMTDLAVTVGGGLESFAVLADEDLPCDHGLLVWGRRPVAKPIPELPLAPLAVAWSARGGHIDVTLYEHLPTADREAERLICHQVADPPALMQLWETRLRADGRDRPWAAVEDAEDSYRVLRTLLATWLLIRQPVETRRGLHQVDEVAASKGDQKRISRRGGDPTRTVRYVTLRQALRRDPGDTGDHAGRIYRHRWFVTPHRVNQYYPSTGEHRRQWRGPHLVTPAGCENAPILGADRVHVLRR